jgi:cell fate (sporulation/competence/biofilm development) regulator YlbF (YheA/YmcA/DUF963 family)
MAELVVRWKQKQQLNAKLKIMSFFEEQMELKGYNIKVNGDHESSFKLEIWNVDLIGKVRDMKQKIENPDDLDPIVVLEANKNYDKLKADLTAIVIEIMTEMKEQVQLCGYDLVIIFVGRHFVKSHTMRFND